MKTSTTIALLLLITTALANIMNYIQLEQLGFSRRNAQLGSKQTSQRRKSFLPGYQILLTKGYGEKLKQAGLDKPIPGLMSLRTSQQQAYLLQQLAYYQKFGKIDPKNVPKNSYGKPLMNLISNEQKSNPNKIAINYYEHPLSNFTPNQQRSNRVNRFQTLSFGKGGSNYRSMLNNQDVNKPRFLQAVVAQGNLPTPLPPAPVFNITGNSNYTHQSFLNDYLHLLPLITRHNPYNTTFLGRNPLIQYHIDHRNSIILVAVTYHFPLLFFTTFEFIKQLDNSDYIFLGTKRIVQSRSSNYYWRPVRLNPDMEVTQLVRDIASGTSARNSTIKNIQGQVRVLSNGGYYSIQANFTDGFQIQAAMLKINDQWQRVSVAISTPAFTPSSQCSSVQYVVMTRQIAEKDELLRQIYQVISSSLTRHIQGLNLIGISRGQFANKTIGYMFYYSRGEIGEKVLNLMYDQVSQRIIYAVITDIENNSNSGSSQTSTPSQNQNRVPSFNSSNQFIRPQNSTLPSNSSTNPSNSSTNPSSNRQVNPNDQIQRVRQTVLQLYPFLSDSLYSQIEWNRQATRIVYVLKFVAKNIQFYKIGIAVSFANLSISQIGYLNCP